MMNIRKEENKLFNKSQVDHNQVIQRLVAEGSPRKTFLMLILVSCLIATLGLLNESVSVVIGAMLVAPLLWPVLSFAMGVVILDWRLIRLSGLSIIASVFVALVTAIPITFQYVPLGSETEILKQTDFTFMFPVALASGFAAAFALVDERLREAIPGIAISVALIPPLVSIGIGLGGTDWDLVIRAVNAFLINLFGIIGMSMVVFLLFGFRSKKKAVEVAVQKEEKVLTK